MTAIILYTMSILFLIISFFKDKEKTKLALKNSWRSFESIMPQFLAIIIVIGILLSIVNQDYISKVIGENSGVFGVFVSSVMGSILLLPNFVSFSVGNSLLVNGAGYAQVGALITTFTMVGIVTINLEIKYIGKKAAITRNFVAFLFSFVVAMFIGILVNVL
ncbi:MAG: permease [Clostridioides sp.]|nr:permease [Clostridioides sp.]